MAFDPRLVIDEEKWPGLESSVVTDRPHDILVGLPANDPRYMDSMPALAAALESVPRDELKGGAYAENGNHDGFERLFNIQGVPALPLGEPPYDAPSHLGSKAPSAQSLALFSVVCGLLAPPAVKGYSASINKHASIGAPSRSKDPDDKIRMALTWCDNAEAIVRNVAAGRLRQLRSQYSLVWVFTVGSRHQPDPPKRQREVLSYDGGWVMTDITPPEPWAGHDPRWRRCRNRVINVAPMSAFALRALARSWKKHMDAVAPFSFVHTHAAALSARLASYPTVRFFDVSNHDWNIPWELVTIFATELARKVGSVWSALLLMTMRQPQLLRPDRPKGRGSRVEGDPFDILSFRARYVNPSGMPPTSELARLAGVVYAIDGIARVGGISGDEASVVALLRGENPNWCILNAGDNLAIGGPSDQAVEDAMASVDYVTIGPAGSFLGLVPFRDRAGRGLSFEPSITSYVYNLVMPGRSASDPQRGDPLIGAGPRRAYYAGARAFKQVDDLLCTVIGDYWGVDYRRQTNPTGPRFMIDRVRQILEENPDSIYYKLDKDEIPKPLLDELFITIPPDRMQRLVDGVNRGGGAGRFDYILKQLMEA